MLALSIERCAKQSCVSRRALVQVTRFVASDASSQISSTNEAHSTSPSARPKASNPVRFRHRRDPMKKNPIASEQQPRASNPAFVKPSAAAKPAPSAHSPKAKAASPRKNLVKNSKRPAPKKQSPEMTFPSSSWVQITNIPVLSTLDDVLNSVTQVLEMEKERGIIDLDSTDWDEDGPLPLLDLTEEEPWVLSAKLVLSTHYRPSGWRLEFANRSIAHALLQHTTRSALHCAWKPVTVEEYNNNEEQQRQDLNVPQLQISDATVRIENCSDKMSVDYMRHILRRYDLSMEPPSILKLERFKTDTLFLVNFEDASWARAAVRELQGIQIYDKELRLCQYPKQILYHEQIEETDSA